MIDLWLVCRRYAGPMTAQPLPCAGAAGDQPAALLDAFLILDGLTARKERRDG